MLFKPELLAKVLSGEKTVTRRIKKPGETAVARRPRRFDTCVIDAHGRLKWREGNVYAACPGRGKVQQGRIRIKQIREECVSSINEADAVAEGFASRDEFLQAWDKINGKGKRDVFVWVLMFELVK
jgi:hypothetical protein